jgi:hypothetical protein
MKMYSRIIFLLCALSVSQAVAAREVTINTHLVNYEGNSAYLAIYLTDVTGQYQRTLWLAGTKAKYYKHLADWSRGSAEQPKEYDGLSGASVNSGASLSVTVMVDDQLIDNGYLIRVDTAVEDLGEYRVEVELPLTSVGAGVATSGTHYIKSLSYTF